MGPGCAVVFSKVLSDPLIQKYFWNFMKYYVITWWTFFSYCLVQWTSKLSPFAYKKKTLFGCKQIRLKNFRTVMKIWLYLVQAVCPLGVSPNLYTHHLQCAWRCRQWFFASLRGLQYSSEPLFCALASAETSYLRVLPWCRCRTILKHSQLEEMGTEIWLKVKLNKCWFARHGWHLSLINQWVFNAFW